MCKCVVCGLLLFKVGVMVMNYWFLLGELVRNIMCFVWVGVKMSNRKFDRINFFMEIIVFFEK